MTWRDISPHWLYLLIIPGWLVLLWLAGRYEQSLYGKATNTRQALWLGTKGGCVGAFMWLLIVASVLWALYGLATG